jgi:ABC-type phosphate/phosphonate transport system substrate-binding protein
MSQSGWAALALEAPEVLRGPRLCTGGHRLSALAVRKGDADFATIDAVTWLHLEAAGETAGLKIIHRTAPTPGLPYITAKSGPVGALFDATAQAIAMLTPQDRDTLHLKGLVTLSASTYALPLPPPV